MFWRPHFQSATNVDINHIVGTPQTKEATFYTKTCQFGEHQNNTNSIFYFRTQGFINFLQLKKSVPQLQFHHTENVASAHLVHAVQNHYRYQMASEHSQEDLHLGIRLYDPPASMEESIQLETAQVKRWRVKQELMAPIQQMFWK